MAQHLSIRVPWHDNGYCGQVCNKPCNNNSCLRLKNISENRVDEKEKELAGMKMLGNEMHLSCISEGAAFMSPESLIRQTVHPYKKSNPDSHGHFLETDIEYPQYALPARPFRWTMKGTNIAYPLKEKFNIDFQESREPIFKFNTIWVQEAQNQREIFKYFYKNVLPKQSICIPYAKQVPFIDDSRRVVIGLGLVDKVIPAVEHKHTGEGDLRSMTWETMICHTIREDRSNGFLFPYNELMEYAETHPEFDIKETTVFVSDEYFDEFSYATEHVSHDAVIDVLLQSLKVLSKIKECIEGDWDKCIRWVNERLTEVWKDRGAYPGIGSMLCAAGFQFGILIAEELRGLLDEGKDVFELLDKIIKEPYKYLSQSIAKSISELNQNSWINLSIERKKLFKLMSRFSFTAKQAEVYFNVEQRVKHNISCLDSEFIENPYLFYEKSRNVEQELQISLKKVDMAVFPKKDIQDKFPLDLPSRLNSDNDKRRVRAFAINILEGVSQNGHTIYPCNNLVLDINDLTVDPPCRVTLDDLNGIKEFIGEEIEICIMKDGKLACQLKRYKEIAELVRSSVSKRVNSRKRHQVNVDWRRIVDDAFGVCKDDKEEKARIEKTAVLKELSEARLSVLIGGAGTGKTTLLSLLCSSEEIQNGGILVLAPTGKARVRINLAMGKRDIKVTAKTVAQFLVQNKRYDFRTQTYHLSDVPVSDVPNTVIIDESSMLTEEMFGALLQSLKSASRIIFVGDPNQLPPIGAGRPFVDLVRFLNKDLGDNVFPRVTKSYGELKITRRQQSNEIKRYDTELAGWFKEGTESLDENIFEMLQSNNTNEHVIFKMWRDNEELERLILECVAEETGMDGIDDIEGFNKSLGGVVTEKGTYFNSGNATVLDDWLILAPVKNMPFGVNNINRLIHEKYRQSYMELSKRTWNKKIPGALGNEKIVYGDKVINTFNEKRVAYPQVNALNYVANGEIGIAAGSFGKQTKFLNVEFSSQPGFTYSYTQKDFGDEVESPLELAYALTIHKAQGSEFKKVILVLNEPCRLISKELLYTAITRQCDKLIILYNDEAYHLRKYSSMIYSDIAKRFTNLFEVPNIVKVNDKYYENGLIHKTLRGELVRSKSEVIIANMLYQNNIDYEYEKEIKLDGYRKIPDFTIEDQESGETYYWEHCGMMQNAEYKKRWENKKRFYEKYGIVEGENLIVTYDDENGSIDSQTIQKYISENLI